MKTNCKNLKIKLDRTLFCKKKNKMIKLCNCTNCKYKEYNKPNDFKKSPLKIGKSKRISKLEKNRFSIMYNKDNECCICKSTNNLTWHELYRGRNRQNSMKYGLCLRLCINCHELYQENKEFNDYWHIQGQLAFIKSYPDLDFVDIFKINYL